MAFARTFPVSGTMQADGRQAATYSTGIVDDDHPPAGDASGSGAAESKYRLGLASTM